MSRRRRLRSFTNMYVFDIRTSKDDVIIHFIRCWQLRSIFLPSFCSIGPHLMKKKKKKMMNECKMMKFNHGLVESARDATNNQHEEQTMKNNTKAIQTHHSEEQRWTPWGRWYTTLLHNVSHSWKSN
jgi:hypothetical protein